VDGSSATSGERRLFDRHQVASPVSGKAVLTFGPDKASTWSEAVRAGGVRARPRRASPREIVERLAYSPDEAAELLGICRELVHDLLRTGQLGSVKAGRRRLIAKHHLEAFLTGKP